MDKTIDMAQEIAAQYNKAERFQTWTHDFMMQSLMELVAVSAAAEREKYKWDIHSCGPTCKRYACVAMREAVEAEREACAKVCESRPLGTEYNNGNACAAAIRARGNT
jgi:hypothetical protein